MRSGTQTGRFFPTVVIAVLPFVVANCSSDGSRDGANSGGGGQGALGGTANAGANAGGGPASGGSTVASGGSPGGPSNGGAAAGGRSNGGASGGGIATGGANSGGASTGGAAAGGVNSGGASAGAGGTANGGASSGGAGGAAGTGTFTLTSPDHMEGAKFAGEFTCALAGFNGSIMPELHWTAGPAGTKSYAITFIDVTLTKGTPPNMNGYHWAIWNIPASTTSLPKAFKNAGSIQATQTGNFLGPCPNFQGSGHTDTYEFTIYALANETLTVSPASGTAGVKDAESKLEMTHLASAKLTGTSDAKPP